MTLYQHCDNPGCNIFERSVGLGSVITDAGQYVRGWIAVDDGASDLHFCSWRCVQVFATAKLPKVKV